MKTISLKIKLLLIVLFSCFCFTGCIVQSLNPYFTENSVLEYPEVEGQWILVKEYGKDIISKNVKPWTIEGGLIQAYNQKDVKSALEATFFKVKDTLFLDIYPESPDETIGFYWTAHLVPVHCVYKVHLEKDRLTLTPLDYEWLKEECREGRVDLQSQWYNDEKDFLFTASSSEWIVFLEKYRDNPKSFPSEKAYVLKSQKRN